MTEKIIFAGFCGQGMMLLGELLAQAAMTDGKYVTYSPSYGTEVRGGTAVITSSFQKKKSFHRSSKKSIPHCYEPASYQKYKDMVKPDGLLVLNSSMIKSNNLPDVKTYRNTCNRDCQ